MNFNTERLTNIQLDENEVNYLIQQIEEVDPEDGTPLELLLVNLKGAYEDYGF